MQDVLELLFLKDEKASCMTLFVKGKLGKCWGLATKQSLFVWYLITTFFMLYLF
jgi:hypothetical protein